MRLTRLLVAGAAAALLGLAAAPAAAGPEQLEQLEPGRGGLQVEYALQSGRGGRSDHAFEMLFGAAPSLAVGMEVEVERSGGRFGLETVGAKLLYRLTPEHAPFGAGLQLQLDFDDRAVLAGTELRFIVEAKNGAWWGQANLMARRRSGGPGQRLGGGYAWSAQRSIAGLAWLGLEGSGQSRERCDPGRCEGTGHYAGPSATVELELGGGSEGEIGFALLRRLAGSGPRSSPTLFVQWSF